MALLLAFALLGLAYSIAVPVFEAPDETWHYNYLRYLAEGHGLPSLLDNDHGAYQEAAQPPLYYALAGLLTWPVQDDDKRELIWHNPCFGYQAPGTVNDNKNMLVHTRREGWPWHGFTLALHLARLVSLAFGMLAVWATWGLARTAAPGRPGLALAAAGLLAFTPQFVFMSAVASNDTAAAGLSTAALWSLLNLAHRPTARQAVLSGGLIGLAWLAKTSTLLLLPLAWICIVYYPELALGFMMHHDTFQRLNVSTFKRSLSLPWCTRRTVLSQVWHLLILTGTALLVGGWWYLRNWVLYGDALGLGAHVQTPWGRPQPVSLLAILPELPQVYRSFWATFGWGGIQLPGWVYWTLGVLLLFSLAGWLVGLVKRVGGSPLGASRTLALAPALLLGLWCAAMFAALLRWMTQVEAPHGRLLFPAIGAGAVLLAAGWAGWGRAAGRALTLLGLGFLGVLALFSPYLVIRPALLPPPLLSKEQLRARAEAVSLVYGGTAELLGWRLGQAEARPGDVLPITLCWQALEPMAVDYTLFVHVLGQHDLVAGRRDTWPGLGRFPTSLWPPGRPFCDIVRVPLEAWAPAPAVYAVEVGLYDAARDVRLDTAGGGLPIVGQVVVRGTPPPAALCETHYDLGGQVTLSGYDLAAAPRPACSGAPAQVRANEPFSLTLYWQAQLAPLDDYKVFVHVLDEAGQLVTQSDSPPRQGDYPTWAWLAGERVADTHTLALPAGRYTLSVGMYHPLSTARLPVRGPHGPVPDDAIPLVSVLVGE